MSDYMDLTIAISESGVSWRPKYAASLVDSTDLDHADKAAVEALTGYGDTPIEASANLLTLAWAMQKRVSHDRT